MADSTSSPSKHTSRAAGFLVIVVINQPVVARGGCAEDDCGASTTRWKRCSDATMPGSMPFIFCPTILTQALRARLADDLGGVVGFISAAAARQPAEGRP